MIVANFTRISLCHDGLCPRNIVGYNGKVPSILERDKQDPIISRGYWRKHLDLRYASWIDIILPIPLAFWPSTVFALALAVEPFPYICFPPRHAIGPFVDDLLDILSRE